jgi:hypothetical protein
MREITVDGELRYDPSEMNNNQLVVTLMLFCTERKEMQYVRFLKDELINRLDHHL